jgi:hypothetical protein
MKTKLKCRIVFTVGGKGGVGKSWLIGLLAQWCYSLAVAICLFDCDDETSTTSRFFPNAKFLTIRSAAEIDQLVQVAAGGEFQVILVDLPARAGDEFQSWFGIVPWDELMTLGIRFTALCVIAGAKDSIESVLRWREFLGDHVDYVLVQNQRDDLSIFLSSRARDQFIAAGVPMVEVAKLDERFAAALDKSNWTLLAALTTAEPHFLSQIMSRARLRKYRDQVFAQFETVKHLLIP